MATSSILGLDSDQFPSPQRPTGIDSLGPSDASDSGSDSAGAYGSDTDSDSDRHGTGERSSVERRPASDSKDILPDRVEQPDDETPEQNEG